MRATTTALTVALAALLLLAGCGGEPDPPSADPTSAPTTSATPDPPTATPADPTEPPLPALARQKSDAGAIAFVEYYWDLVNYAQATGDVDGLEKLGLDTCESCRNGVRGLTKVYRRGGRITGQYTTGRAEAFLLRTTPVLIMQVELSTSVSDGRIVGAGHLDQNLPGGTDNYKFIVAHQQGAWIVSDFKDAS